MALYASYKDNVVHLSNCPLIGPDFKGFIIVETSSDVIAWRFLGRVNANRCPECVARVGAR